jgi:F0F1-type ATP synthase membrane subunit b/b'
MNSTIFILLLGFALKKPTLDFLDRQIVEIRAGLDNAERVRKEASQAKSVASGKMGKWEDTAKGIRKETDKLIAQQLREIHKEFEDAKVQLDKEEQDRRLAEELRAARAIKEDLVNQAVATLEQRYKTESTQARLTASVDLFVRFMERLR